MYKDFYDISTYVKGARVIQIRTCSTCSVEYVDHGITLIS